MAHVATPAILVRDLHKAYGDFEAVRGIDFDVAPGEVFGLLGPNGAGKTTTVEVLEGYRARTSGIVSVLGHDPGRRPRDLRRRVGIVLQSSGIYRHITVHEAVAHWARFYPHPRNVDEVVELAGLTEKRDALARTLSGGQMRRLDFALALIGDPELIFLDEPTTGFDPAARRAAWEVIEGLRELGTTILLTTHYLEEAERPADRVGIIKDGVIVAEGPPEEIGGDERRVARIRFRAPEAELPDGLAPREGWVELRSAAPVADLARLCGWALERGIDLPDLEVVRPSLEDVYLELTAPTPEHAGSP
jgi:ABC-2 type transport system ATP-binding protein